MPFMNSEDKVVEQLEILGDNINIIAVVNGRI